MNNLKLIAIDECEMDDGSKSLTVGKTYNTENISTTQILVTDDDGEEHYFELNPLSEACWARFFKLIDKSNG